MDGQTIAALVGAAVIAIGGVYRAYREIERRAYAQAQRDQTAKTAEQTITRKDRELAEKDALIAEMTFEQARLRHVISTLTQRLESP